MHRQLQELLQQPRRQEVQYNRGVREQEGVEQLSVPGGSTGHNSIPHHPRILPGHAADAFLDAARALCVGGSDGADGDAHGAVLVLGELHTERIEESAEGVFAGGV
jgi:hypothetical protein